MTRISVLSLALAAALALPSAGAFASDKIKLSPETTEKIRVLLQEQGYEVGKIKIDDGLYEAYVRKDGKKYELYLDADLKVVKTEIED